MCTDVKLHEKERTGSVSSGNKKIFIKSKVSYGLSWKLLSEILNVVNLMKGTTKWLKYQEVSKLMMPEDVMDEIMRNCS